MSGNNYIKLNLMISFQGSKQHFTLYKKQLDIPMGYTMGHAKASYVLRHGLGPVVQKELVKDIKTSENLYKVLLDEITTQ